MNVKTKEVAWRISNGGSQFRRYRAEKYWNFFPFFLVWHVHAQMLQRGRPEMILSIPRRVNSFPNRRYTRGQTINDAWQCKYVCEVKLYLKLSIGAQNEVAVQKGHSWGRQDDKASFENCLNKRGIKPNQVFVLCKPWLNGRGVVCNFLLLLRWIRVSAFFVSLSDEVWKWFSSRLR